VTADRLSLYRGSDDYLIGKGRGMLDESNAENYDGNAV
jgi:hypothetical protein